MIPTSRAQPHVDPDSPSIALATLSQGKRRLLYLVARADAVGGAQMHVMEVAARSREDGHSVLVVTGPGEPYARELRSRGVPFLQIDCMRREVSPWHDLRALLRIRAVMREFRPDLVSVHSSKTGVLGRVAARLEKLPCLYTAHGWVFAGELGGRANQLYRHIERRLAPWAEQIICVSEAVRRTGIEIGIDPGRLRTIHNSRHDVGLEGRAHPARTGLVRVAVVARLDAPKDHELLFDAARGIPGVHFDVVGGGPNHDALVAQARRNGLSVDFLGEQRDVTPFLARAQVFALISRQEGFPRATLEAMRAGLPVIVSDVGGSSEAVHDGTNGYLVAPGDEATLRDRLVRLVEDADLRARFGQAGRRRFENEFNFERMYAPTWRTYRDVLNGKARKSSSSAVRELRAERLVRRRRA